MPIRVLSYEEIYSAISLHNIKYKAIITFMLSTGFNRDTIINLTINDLLRGCGKNENKIDSLKKLLDENPFEILPYWISDDESNFKLIFNSYESTFYLFLYLKDRFSHIKKCDEALFASNNNGDKYDKRTLLTTISRPYKNDDFRPRSIILTFKNVCETFVVDNEVKKLFLGISERYNSENEILDALNDELFKEKLVNTYKRLIPHLTAGYFMYEHLTNYVIQNVDRENYKEKIHNYFTNSYRPRFNDYSDANLGKMPYKAYSIAEEDMRNNRYLELPAYYNKILTQAELFVIFEKTETRLGDDAYRNRDFENFNPVAPIPRINLLIQCIDDMELDGIKIADMFQWGSEEIRIEVIRQLGLNNCYMGEFSYDLFKKVLFDTMYVLLEAYNF